MKKNTIKLVVNICSSKPTLSAISKLPFYFGVDYTNIK